MITKSKIENNRDRSSSNGEFLTVKLADRLKTATQNIKRKRKIFNRHITDNIPQYINFVYVSLYETSAKSTKADYSNVIESSKALDRLKKFKEAHYQNYIDGLKTENSNDKKIKEISHKALFLNSEEITTFLLDNSHLIAEVTSIIDKIKEYFVDNEIRIALLVDEEYNTGDELSLDILTEEDFEVSSQKLDKFRETYWDEKWLNLKGRVSVGISFI